MNATATPTTSKQVQGLIQMARALADAIKELGTVPSGELYARVMGHMTINIYNLVIDALVSTKLITIDGSHLITWVGPR